uniref:Uncharacterized protein n=1 Tax=Romanomermis culicivorax TaxID=13658 RepID=A0A915KQL0_ROMCU
MRASDRKSNTCPKLASEGYLARAQTDKRRHKYKKEVYKCENISLDPSKSSKNYGKRALAKLMVNSSCRKFGQQNNMGKTVMLNNLKLFSAITTNSANIVKTVNIIKDTMISVVYHQLDDFAEVI